MQTKQGHHLHFTTDSGCEGGDVRHGSAGDLPDARESLVENKTRFPFE
jgi:hypothetical protein